MELPKIPFFLFGMGGRRKMLYKAGALLDPATGEVIQQWDIRAEKVEPADYAVHLETRRARLHLRGRGSLLGGNRCCSTN
jgi:hypothetical protein